MSSGRASQQKSRQWLDGKVTVKRPGTVTITATAADGSGKKAAVKLRITAPAKTVKIIGVENGDVFAPGTIFKLSAEVGPSKAANKKVVWIVDRKSVV